MVYSRHGKGAAVQDVTHGPRRTSRSARRPPTWPRASRRWRTAWIRRWTPRSRRAVQLRGELSVPQTIDGEHRSAQQQGAQIGDPSWAAGTGG